MHDTDILEDARLLGGLTYHLTALLYAIDADDPAALTQQARTAREYVAREKPDLYAYVCTLLNRHGW